MQESRRPESGRRPASTKSQIVRHSVPDSPGEISSGSSQLIDEVSAHIATHIGRVESVFHELVSPRVHLDVHWVKPSTKIPANVLVTSGMAEAPMTVPPGYDGPQYMELCCFLPPDWAPDFAPKTGAEDLLQTERWYWPVRWLKSLARLPHEYSTFLGYGHTVPNGEDPQPFCDNVEFCGMLVTYPHPVPAFASLQVGDHSVAFMQIVPLYKEEMSLKLKRGAETLERAWRSQSPLQMFNAGRKNAGKKFLGLF